MNQNTTDAAIARTTSITIRDVARACGVSTATVSKALNRKADVAQATRERVLSVCEKLGYRLNSSIQDLARRGRNGLTRNIAFVMVGTDFADPAYARAIDGVSQAADEHGLHLILERLRGDEPRVIDLPPVLRDGRVDGMLVTGNLSESSIAMIKRLEIPHVILGAYPRNIIEGSINVRFDFSQRLGDLVRELVRRGCRRIAYFTEIPDNFYEQKSIDAFEGALRENKLPVDGALIYKGSGPFSGAIPVMLPVFQQRQLPFDAIVCLDFRTAQEISHLIMAHAGLKREPRVIMAVGRPFDYYRLPVPAVYFEGSLDVVAREGVNVLMDWLNGKNGQRPKQIVLNSTIQTKILDHGNHFDSTSNHC